MGNIFVKVTKASSSKYWYSRFIGQTFEVDPHRHTYVDEVDGETDVDYNLVDTDFNRTVFALNGKHSSIPSGHWISVYDTEGVERVSPSINNTHAKIILEEE